MEREIVLGIDYGGKYTGLAVVDRRNNQVLYARTVKMRDDIADILKGRREQGVSGEPFKPKRSG